jgi:hypothetical protein
MVVAMKNSEKEISKKSEKYSEIISEKDSERIRKIIFRK